VTVVFVGGGGGGDNARTVLGGDRVRTVLLRGMVGGDKALAVVGDKARVDIDAEEGDNVPTKRLGKGLGVGEVAPFSRCFLFQDPPDKIQVSAESATLCCWDVVEMVISSSFSFFSSLLGLRFFLSKDLSRGWTRSEGSIRILVMFVLLSSIVVL
jgi:hypothetical protein